MNLVHPKINRTDRLLRKRICDKGKYFFKKTSSLPVLLSPGLPSFSHIEILGKLRVTRALLVHCLNCQIRCKVIELINFYTCITRDSVKRLCALYYPNID